MKVLNADIVPKKGTVPIDTPETIGFKVRDRGFVFDCNSMVLQQVNTVKELTKTLADGVLHKPVFPFQGRTRARYTVFQTTHACNFRCSYCSVQAYYPGIDMMSFETAKRAINHFYPNQDVLKQDAKSNIGFFGGEPLLNWDLITAVTTYFEGLCHPRRPHFHVTTNGALIDAKKAKFFAEHDYSFIVSLDGPEKIHDACRVYKNGKGTFKSVMKGLEELKKVGLGKKVSPLRATFTAATADTLLERVKFLNQLCYDGYANWVSVEPAFITESLCGDSSKISESVTEETAAKIEGEYLRVADWFVEEVRAGRRPSFHNISKFLERLLWCIPYATECGSATGYCSVNGKGELFGCHREQSSYIGHLDKGGVDESIRAKWIDNRFYSRDKCTSCPIRHVCGGGCRERSIGEYNDIRKPVDVECSLKRVFFRTAAWIMSELGPAALRKVIPMPLALSRQQQSKESKQ